MRVDLPALGAADDGDEGSGVHSGSLANASVRLSATIRRPSQAARTAASVTSSSVTPSSGGRKAAGATSHSPAASGRSAEGLQDLGAAEQAGDRHVAAEEAVADHERAGVAEQRAGGTHDRLRQRAAQQRDGRPGPAGGAARGDAPRPGRRAAIPMPFSYWQAASLGGGVRPASR